MAKPKTTPKPIQPSKGVVLFAFGKREYYFMAYLMAYSIKHHSPNVLITVFTDNENNFKAWNEGRLFVFDSIVQLPEKYTTYNDRFDPCWAKLNMYNYLPYDYSMYLDVDGIALCDINPLFEGLMASNKPYISHTEGWKTKDELMALKNTHQWLTGENIWNHFGLKEGDKYQLNNSSLQFIAKSKQAESLFKTAVDLYKNKQVPKNMLANLWGGGQPDELYMAVSMTINSIDAKGPAVKSGKGYINFEVKNVRPFQEIEEEYYFMSYLGPSGLTSPRYVEWMNKLLSKMHQAKGQTYLFNLTSIIKQKYANQK
jgi:hypothetical protein